MIEYMFILPCKVCSLLIFLMNVFLPILNVRHITCIMRKLKANNLSFNHFQTSCLILPGNTFSVSNKTKNLCSCLEKDLVLIFTLQNFPYFQTAGWCLKTEKKRKKQASTIQIKVNMTCNFCIDCSLPRLRLLLFCICIRTRQGIYGQISPFAFARRVLLKAKGYIWLYSPSRFLIWTVHKFTNH